MHNYEYRVTFHNFNYLCNHIYELVMCTDCNIYLKHLLSKHFCVVCFMKCCQFDTQTTTAMLIRRYRVRA